MSYLKEQAEWADGIYQIETSDPVLGGPDGIANRPACALANRTVWLKQQLKEAEAALTAHTRSRNHPDASLSEKGFVKLSNANQSSSETEAATPKAVKIVNDRLNAVVDSAPSDLDTLNKLAKAISNNPKFAENVMQLLSQKLAKNENGADIPDKNLFLKNLGFLELTINTLYPVGIVAFFAQNKNPNNLFHGTTWQYIGENKTIRLAKADGSNVLTMGGSDAIKLTEAQIPLHAHTFSGKTSSFDYGTKQTNTTDNHVHGVNSVGNEYRQVRSGDHFSIKTAVGPKNTSPSGSHYHTVYMGPHVHTFSGSTDNRGSGSAINITNAFVTLMGWYRTH